MPLERLCITTAIKGINYVDPPLLCAMKILRGMALDRAATVRCLVEKTLHFAVSIYAFLFRSIVPKSRQTQSRYDDVKRFLL